MTHYLSENVAAESPVFSGLPDPGDSSGTAAGLPILSQVLSSKVLINDFQQQFPISK
jgi:hypothetical protein